MMTRGQLLDRIIDERFLLQMKGILFKPNHKLFDIVDKMIQQEFTTGLVDYYTKPYFHFLNKKKRRFQPLKGPKVLTLKHLEAGFLIWLACICFAAMAFVCEWLNRLKDELVLKYLLLAFYDQKKLESSFKLLDRYVLIVNKNIQIK